MKPLSQQIRELVEKSHTSSYAIGREAGIDKSTMSRFMNGGRLTMDKLDSLGCVLGVVVTSEVSLVPMPLEKGRPKQKTETVKMNAKTAQRCADNCAREAFTDNFHSRRGVWHHEKLDCLVYYNNNPFGLPNGRAEEIKLLEKSLKSVGINVLARGWAGKPSNESDKGYTLTLVLDCSQDRMNEVVDIAQASCLETIQKLFATTKSAKK